MKTLQKHILLVEDDPAHAKLLIRQVTESGEEVSIARVKDGEEALAYVYRQGAYVDSPRPDLILLDLNLPKLDGHEVLRRLKEDEKLQMIPVIMLTTSDSDRDVTEAYRHRANSYLVKPIDFEQYKRMVRDLNAYWAAWNQSPVSSNPV